MKTGIISAALVAIAVQPAVAEAQPRSAAPAAAPLQLPYRSANLPTSAQVQSFYAGWRFAPIWFNGNSVKPAASTLIEILRRSSLDGVAMGPQYAAQLQAAVQQAAVVGSPENIAFAEHSLSEALVFYAQMMQRPVPGMIYGYEYLKPKPPSADAVLRTAAGARPMENYLTQIANPNTVYTSIRDAAWQQMQASGSALDPRVVANLERARGMPAKGRFVLVNPATQMLTMYENGVPVDSMKVVVGDTGKYLRREGTRTPLVASMMFYVIHNPYWNAPFNLVRENIAPRYLAEGDKYLKYRGFKVMSDWSANATVIPASEVDWKAVKAGKLNIRIRQDPGPDNFMGELKFPFANSEDIYLHDTDPADRDLFALSERTRSNGCVRLEDAKRLATWLLGHPPVAGTTQPEYAEQLRQGVPVYVTYLTAQPRNGQLTFVKDVYGWDPSGAAGSTQVAAGQ